MSDKVYNIYKIDRVTIKLNNIPDAIEINNAEVIKSCITYLSIEDWLLRSHLYIDDYTELLWPVNHFILMNVLQRRALSFYWANLVAISIFEIMSWEDCSF